MNRTCGLLFLIMILAATAVKPASAQTGDGLIIKTPQAGDVLQGATTIVGSDNVIGFVSSEVAFAYTGDSTGTWFLISANSRPVEDGVLAVWDTTTITDGNYVLRLRVYLSNGSFQDAIISYVRVRNYTPIETPTPTSTPLQPTLVPTATLTPTPFPTPTSISPNPAILTSMDVSISVAYGGLAAIILFSVIGVYLWLRRK